VPEDAAAGKAKMTLSFPDWKDRQVAATTVEVIVEEGGDAEGKE
jgi:hypothetical protein